MLEQEQNTDESPRQAAHSLPHIAARFLDTPLLIQPDKVQALAWALRGRIGVSIEERPEGRGMEAVGPGLIGQRMDPAAGYFVDRGVAVVPIRGTLVNRGAWIGTDSGLMSYEGISHQLHLAARDDRVQAVMFDVHSYGGEASGVDDLGRQIRSFEKPIYAMIDGAGSSAAYWIAAAADRVYIANSSHGGSVGVVVTHASFQKALEEKGITVTHIHAGAEKVLGSPYKDLSEGDREKLQARVDQTYRFFVEAIAEFRGMSTEDVRSTEAAVFTGPELVERGMADGVTIGRRLLAAIQDNFEDPDPNREPGFLSGSSRANAQTGDPFMSEQNRNSGAEQAAKTHTQAEVDACIAEASTNHQGELAAAKAEGATAERQRISGILGCEAAKARPGLAQKLAFSEQAYSEGAATEILEGAAEERADSDPLGAAMAGKTPGINPDEGEEAEEAEVQPDASSIYASRRVA